MGHKDHHNVAECSLLASFFLESKNKNKTKPDRPPKSLAQINTLTHSCWCSYQLYSLETKATYLPLDTASASNFWRGGCRQRDPVLPVANFYNILGRFFCCCCSFFCCFFFSSTSLFSLLSGLVGQMSLPRIADWLLDSNHLQSLDLLAVPAFPPTFPPPYI